MKRIIIGKQGSGKTTLIKEMLQTIDNYVILDLMQQYSEFFPVVVFDHIIGNVLKDKFLEWIKEIPKDLTIVIDETQFLYFPKFKKDKGYGWLVKELNDRNYILAFQSIHQVIEGNFTGFEEFQLLELRDSKIKVDRFVRSQTAEKKLFTKISKQN